MKIKVGQKFMIAGMTIEGDKWETRNITTWEIVLFDKTVLLNAIQLGKADEVTESLDLSSYALPLYAYWYNETVYFCYKNVRS